jgi:hypothetical protein
VSVSSDDITERAERLRVLLALAGEEPALTADDRERLGVVESMDMHDQYLIDHHSFTGDDLGLALDLIATAHVLRDFHWQMLEELLALLPGGDAPLPRQLMALHGTDAFYEACWRVAQLEWMHPPHEGGR